MEKEAPQAGHWRQRKEIGINETYSPSPSPSPYLWKVNITSTYIATCMEVPRYLFIP